LILWISHITLWTLWCIRIISCRLSILWINSRGWLRGRLITIIIII
jgi:hypothetical protein